MEVIDNHALPVGMLDQVEVELDRRTLKEGELLIMATDGVLEAGAHSPQGRVDVLAAEGTGRWGSGSRLLAEMILADCIAQADGRVADDMMVVVARLAPAQWEVEAYRRVQSSGL